MLRLSTKCLLALSPLVVTGAAAAQLRWTPLADLPRVVTWPVFDPARDRVIAFGAYGQAANDQIRAFEWNGRWQVHQQASDSGLATITGAVFDRTRGQALVVGQVSTFSPTPVTAVYEGGRFHTIPSGPSSPHAGFVYDAARGEALAFGGTSPFSVVDTMWRWNGSTWSTVNQPALRPSARQGPALVFDPLRARVVLFGGSDAGLTPFGDTWTWDGVAWTPHVTASAPGARFEAGFAYDTARGRCVLFGGTSFMEFGDTWLWDGVTWTQAQPTVSPPPRWHPGMAYDEQRQRVVLLNGMVGGTPILDQWEWDGNAWLQQNPIVRPAGVIGYDRQRGHVIVATEFGSIHAWDGAQWRPVPVFSPIGERPVPMSLTWHDGLDRLVLYTASGSDRTLWALTATPPVVESFGSPCPAGTNNDCDLLALGLPRLGNDLLQLDLRGRAANTYGAVIWGLTPANIPIGSGCTLLVDPFVSQLVFMNVGGYSMLRVPIPAGAVFLGTAVCAQGFVLDGTGPIGGVSASAGLRLQLGR